MSLKTLTFIFVSKGKATSTPVSESQWDITKGFGKAKSIVKKLLEFSAVIMLPLLVIFAVFLFANIKMFFFILAVCAIGYFWIETVEVFAEAKVLTKRYLITYLIIGTIYLLFSLGLGARSLISLVEFGFASATAFCVFKGYNIVMRGLVGKDINLTIGSLINIMTLGLTILLFNLNKIVFGVFVAVIMVAYEILFWVARFIIENRSHKVYISDMYGDYDG